MNPKEISIHVGDLGLYDEAKLLEGVVARDYEDDIDQKPLRIQVLDRLVKPAVNTAKLLEGVVARDYEDDIDQKPLRIQVLDRLVKPAVNTNDVQTIRYEVIDSAGNKVEATRNYRISNYAPVFAGLDKITFRQGRASATGVSLTDGVSRIKRR